MKLFTAVLIESNYVLILISLKLNVAWNNIFKGPIVY